MRRAVPGELHGLVAPGMRAALSLGAVGDADTALHGAILAILMGAALAIYALGLRGVVGRGTQRAEHGSFFLALHGVVGTGALPR